MVVGIVLYVIIAVFFGLGIYWNHSRLDWVDYCLIVLAAILWPAALPLMATS